MKKQLKKWWNAIGFSISLTGLFVGGISAISILGLVNSLISLINALIVSLCLKNSNEVVGNIEELGTVIDNFEYSGNDEINMLDEDVIMELKNMSDKV